MKNSAKIAVTGAILFVGGVVIGVAVTVLGMMNTFNTIANSPDKVSPSQVAGGLSYALMATSIGMCVSAVGFCLLIGGAIAYMVGRKRCRALQEPDPRGPQSAGVIQSLIPNPIRPHTLSPASHPVLKAAWKL